MLNYKLSSSLFVWLQQTSQVKQNAEICLSDYSFCNVIQFRYDSINYSEIADRDFEINARNEWPILGSCLWLNITRSLYCVSPRQSSGVWRNTKLWRTFFVKQPGACWSMNPHSLHFILMRWWQLQLQFVEFVLLAWSGECKFFACKIQFLTLVFSG